MTANQLERILVDDLQALGERLADERLCRDLYRALAGRALSKRGDEGHVALSYRRAEEVLNTARQGNALPPLQGLASSGGEEEVTERAQEALDEVGWRSRPEDHGHADPQHISSAAGPPPAARPDSRETPEWERRAHEEAERNRLR